MATPKKNIFFFYGNDTYSSSEKVRVWREQFAKKYNDDLNISLIEGKQLTPAQFRSETEAMPFLADKRLTIVKGFLNAGKTDHQKKIAEIIETTPDHSIVVFHEIQSPDKRTSLFKKLKKIATIEEFKPLEGLALSQWITKKATQKNATINSNAANLLASLVGSNLWQLNNEIAKLSLYCKGRTIENNDVNLLASKNFSESIFTLTDAIAAKRPQKSLDTFHTLIASGEEIPRIFYMIVRHFRILLQVKELMDKGYQHKQIVDEVKEHPFVIKNTMQQARNFSQQLLVLVYRQLLGIEIAMKSGGIKLLVDDQRDLIIAIERLVMKLCR